VVRPRWLIRSAHSFGIELAAMPDDAQIERAIVDFRLHFRSQPSHIRGISPGDKADMAADQIAYPEWTDCRDKSGLDPLGMQNSSINLYQRLLPGISKGDEPAFPERKLTYEQFMAGQRRNPLAEPCPSAPGSRVRRPVIAFLGDASQLCCPLRSAGSARSAPVAAEFCKTLAQAAQFDDRDDCSDRSRPVRRGC
jgi:hypothetical protein